MTNVHKISIGGQGEGDEADVVLAAAFNWIRICRRRWNGDDYVFEPRPGRYELDRVLYSDSDPGGMLLIPCRHPAHYDSFASHERLIF